MNRALIGLVVGAGLLVAPLWAGAQPAAPVVIKLRDDQPGPQISRYLFGQFAEHLGEGIYGGVWVGRDSKIPNVRGIRTDVVQALRTIEVPDVRWPGGCFADRYHWRDGIGPAAGRRKTVNSNWGNVAEPNSFGTEEYMDFIDQIGGEAYVTVNIGSGSTREAADWLEYMTTPLQTSLGEERAANGHPDPYKIKFLGLGNESWGCGGPMSPDAYVGQMELYSNFAVNFNPAQRTASPLLHQSNSMDRIAVGPNAGDTGYTEAIMRAWHDRDRSAWDIEALSLHSYTYGKALMSSSAVGFSEDDYAAILKQTLNMDQYISTHSAIMDRYDPEKHVALAVDEWGVWLTPMPATNPLFLKQQNSLRDGILAALNLNIFARHADRVRIANIAQMVNVLQSMVLTDGDKMLLTPTYYVFKMYVPFHDAKFIPVSLPAGEYRHGDVVLPRVDAIAARAKDGRLWLAVTNIDPHQGADVDLRGASGAATSAAGETLTAEQFNAVNTFSAPATVAPAPVSARAEGGSLILHLPPSSVTVVHLGP